MKTAPLEQAGRPVFRLFVSSTFSDMFAEREALVRDVFPRIRAYCAERDAEFQPIDLRWGISDEAGFDHRTMPICLEEIARCRQVTPRPNFVVLLGDRYGWRPLPSAIPDTEWQQIGALLNPTEFAEVSAFYRRDDNAVPPAWMLRPRVGELRDAALWHDAEVRLGALLRKAASGLQIEAADRAKFEASATEQEIAAGALRVEGAVEHVHCFFRSIRGLPSDQRAAGFRDLTADGVPDEDARLRLDELKRRLRHTFAGNVHEYATDWLDGGPAQGYLEQLSADVYGALTSAIDYRLARLPVISPPEQETGFHRAFGSRATEVFVGRQAELRRLDDYVRHRTPAKIGDRLVFSFKPGQSDVGPSVVVGPPGSGKSSLLARLAQDAALRDPSLTVVLRFLGTTLQSSTFTTALDDVVREIRAAYGAEGDGRSGSPSEAMHALEEAMKLASESRPLLVVLDAIDQIPRLNKPDVLWLPLSLPEHAKLVVSVVDDPGVASALHRQGTSAHEVDLGPFPHEAAAELLDRWLRLDRRTLQPSQRDVVLGGFAGNRTPLYLKLAFEAARRWRSFAEPSETTLGATTDALVDELFGRLSDEGEHGALLVGRFAGMLAAARLGLSETEMIDVLSADSRLIGQVNARGVGYQVDRLPVAVWSRLMYDFTGYLSTRAVDGIPVVAFFHRQFKEAAARLYLGGINKYRVHRRLARHFRAVAAEPAATGGVRDRASRELSYQLLEGADRDAFFDTVGDVDVWQRRAQSEGGLAGVSADINRGCELFPDKPKRGRLRNARRRVLERISGSLTIEREPLEQAMDSVAAFLLSRVDRDDAAVTGLDHRLLSRLQADGRPWLRLVAPVESLGRPLALLSYDSTIIACGITPDGGRVAAACLDGTIRVSDVSSGVELVRVPVGDEINCGSIAPDGTGVLVASWDGALRMFDVATGSYTFRGETRELSDCAVGGYRGQRVAVALVDDVIEVVLGFGGYGVELRGHVGPVTACAVSLDGSTLVSGGSDGTVRIWNVARVTAAQAAREALTSDIVVDAHQGDVTTLALSGDARLLVSAGGDGHIAIWDSPTGTLRERFAAEGFTREVALSGDGRTLAARGARGRVAVWRLPEVEAGGLLPASSWPNSIGMSEDGSVIAVGASDGHVTLWDPRVSAEEGSDTHLEVVSLAANPTGSFVASATSARAIGVWEATSGLQIAAIRGEEPAEQRVLNCEPIVWWTSEADGARLNVRDCDGSISSWDENGWRAAESASSGSTLRHVRVRGDGRWIASWDNDTVAMSELGGDHVRWQVVGPRVADAAFSADGELLYVAADTGEIGALETRTGRVVAEVRTDDYLHRILVDPAGQSILTTSFKPPDAIRRWPLPLGAPPLVIGLNKTWDALLSARGTLLITSDGKAIAVWDPSRRQPPDTTQLEVRSRSLSLLATNAAETQLAIGLDGSVAIWDLRSRTWLARMPIPGGPREVVFLPDGTLAIGDGYGRVHFAVVET